MSWYKISLGVIFTALFVGGPRMVVGEDVYRSHDVQRVVALLTDFGWQDSAVGSLKGAILTEDPAARIVDISHSIVPFNLVQGAYLLDQAASRFPGGTIFVGVVYPHIRSERPPILVKTKLDKYFLAPDNGLLSVVIAREGVAKAWTLKDSSDSDKPGTGLPTTATGQDLFAMVAAHLAQGESDAKWGDEIDASKVVGLPNRQPSLVGATISLLVVGVDRDGNILTNLKSTDDVATKLKPDTLIKISAKGQVWSGPLVPNYSEIPKEHLGLIYGPDKQLEIVKKQGSAARDLNLVSGDTVLLHL